MERPQGPADTEAEAQAKARAAAPKLQQLIDSRMAEVLPHCCSDHAKAWEADQVAKQRAVWEAAGLCGDCGSHDSCHLYRWEKGSDTPIAGSRRCPTRYVLEGGWAAFDAARPEPTPPPCQHHVKGKVTEGNWRCLDCGTENLPFSPFTP
jgi:hypothetical protein